MAKKKPARKTPAAGRKEERRSFPFWWHCVLALVEIAGVYLIWAKPHMPAEMAKISVRVRPEAWSLFLGIVLVSVAATNVVISAAHARVKRLFGLEITDHLKNLWPPAIMGVCESIMYPMALFFGKLEFIGVWLAIKVAGQWSRWNPVPQGGSASEENVERSNEGRRRYAAFLVGNALSIMAACITWAALKMWTSP